THPVRPQVSRTLPQVRTHRGPDRGGTPIRAIHPRSRLPRHADRPIQGAVSSRFSPCTFSPGRGQRIYYILATGTAVPSIPLWMDECMTQNEPYSELRSERDYEK